MATLKSSTFTDLSLPQGTTAQRPGSPTRGMTRYNTDHNLVEFYDGSAWRPVTGYSAGTVGTGGNTIETRGSGIVHMFTGTGAFTFTPSFTGYVQVLVVAGGGGGGHSSWGGGGGAGGMTFNRAYPVSSGTGVSVTVGGGSTGKGGDSVFGTITSTGGGHSGYWDSTTVAQPGGSGGGGGNASADSSRARCFGGLGVTGQGFPGGSGVRYNDDGENTHNGGGGGGAGGPGWASQDSNQKMATYGGPGAASDILGDVFYWAGGGASGPHICDGGGGDGGVGGGGGGAAHYYPSQPLARSSGFGGAQTWANAGGNATNNGTHGNGGGNGAANTGGGGGAGGGGGVTGGSGMVIVRY